MLRGRSICGCDHREASGSLSGKAHTHTHGLTRCIVSCYLSLFFSLNSEPLMIRLSSHSGLDSSSWLPARPRPSQARREPIRRLQLSRILPIQNVAGTADRSSFSQTCCFCPSFVNDFDGSAFATLTDRPCLLGLSPTHFLLLL